ncbi:uncharacterized protein UV8b_06087 [Ustilaginoidea virens]|uniref:Uncharacterized protein n=1 Tax=Ustilaginoidea virens TaxID=1159556 RepID=A0A8E5MJI2_USTVR|nr:uncharacterized protein UV8b_06087 [Ustilaginoidea virens]QUC21846.1 hypothetical protein UV8b_06087 [Ustilaginoidea virens]
MQLRERGGVLVQRASILGSILIPAGDIVQHRHKLLHKLQPPTQSRQDGVDCVSGTPWADRSSALDASSQVVKQR